MPRKPKIDCFWSPTPDAALGDVGELEEDRELERARVLELVDENQVDLAAETRPHLTALEQLEREHLLVGEVDGTPGALVVLVRAERARRDRVHEAAGRAEVLLQTRMPVVRRGGRDDGLTELRRFLRDPEVLEPPPIGPAQRQAAPHAAENALHLLDRLGGLLRRVDGEIDRTEELAQRRRERTLEGRTVGRRRREEREQSVDAARGAALEGVGADAVGAGEGHDALDVPLPVPRLVETPLHVGEPFGVVRGDDSRHRLAKGHRRGVLVDHSEVGREAELEREVGDEPAADGVHGADPRRAETMRVLDPVRLEQPRPRALFQLGRGAVGERRGEHGVGPRAAVGDRLVQHARQPIGLPAPGARRNDLDARHHEASA